MCSCVDGVGVWGNGWVSAWVACECVVCVCVRVCAYGVLRWVYTVVGMDAKPTLRARDVRVKGTLLIHSTPL